MHTGHRFDAGHAQRGRETQTAMRESRIEDYLMIGGPAMRAADAASRVGVSRSSIVRYRRALRQRYVHAAAPDR